MTSISINPNSIYVSMIKNGFWKVKFDSKYPIHLNGIINQDEFRQSINRINNQASSDKIIRFLSIFLPLSIIGGIILFIIDSITSSYSDTSRFLIFALVGSVLGGCGLIFVIIAVSISRMTREVHMRIAIAEESEKYSSRSPIPCSWRLEPATYYTGVSGNRNNSSLAYYLVIDIGRSTTSENATYHWTPSAPDASILFAQEDTDMPPSYSDSSAGFCTQCGTSRQDCTAKFCSSCGHSFNCN